MKSNVFVFCLIVTLIPLGGCGGNGGGSDFIGAAEVGINTSPPRIDTGDRTETAISISHVDDDGIILKVRYPSGLVYVLSSSFITLDGKKDRQELAPLKVEKIGDESYAVYFLPQILFQGADKEYSGQGGTLTFQLEGVSRVTQGAIAVDADVDDPLIKNEEEFNINKPEFAAEDETFISVTE